MPNFSYIRAATSCLPFIGPLVSVYNACEANNEMALNSLCNSFSNIQTSVAKLGMAFSSFEDNPNAVKNAQEPFRQELQRQKNQRAQDLEKRLLACKKGRVYSICGIVGNVLSLALVVGLIALRILRAPVLISSAGFIVQAVVLSYNLFRYDEAIKAEQIEARR